MLATMERIVDFSTSDFASLVKTASFVDNTLMIREIFNESSKILITAPRQFGKSTNISMVKRFFEIEVDKTGSPRPVHTTKNYRLFKDNNLDICSDEQFFNEHFGKYPVLLIDFEPLAGVCDYINMLNIFRTIVMKTFNEHTFLLDIVTFKVNTMYFNNHQSTINIDEPDLMCSYEYLSKILYRHLKKEVFVLIDNCDAFVNSLLFQNNNADTQKMISFIKVTMDNLLKNNQCVGQALLSGVLPVTGSGFPFYGNNIECYYFLDGHHFFKYYGLTSDKLDKILKKLITDDEERESIKMMINEYYGSYRIQNQNLQVYGIRSVLQFLLRKDVRNYWCSQESIRNFTSAFKILKIRDRIENLLSGHSIQLDTTHILSAADILEVNNLIKSGKTEGPSFSAIHTFFLLFYHFGFLSVNKALGWGFVSLGVPNEEIKHELKKIFSVNQILMLCYDYQLQSNSNIHPPTSAHEFVNILEKFMKAVAERKRLIRMLENYGHQILSHYDSSQTSRDDFCIPSPFCESVNILESFMKGFEERNKLIRIIENYIRNVEKTPDSEAFTIQSILKCLPKRKVLDGSIKTKCLETFLSNKVIFVLIQKILIDNDELLLSKSRSAVIILKQVSKIITSNHIEHPVTDIIYILLYYFGCLVVTREDKNFIYFRIRDEEMKYNLATTLLDTDQTLYYSNQEHANNIRATVNSITLNNMDFYKFGDAIWQWSKSHINHITEHNLLVSLFMILATRLDYSYTMVQKFGDDEVILLKNKHQINFCIAAQGTSYHFKSAGAFTLFAQKGHKRVMNNREEIFDKNRNGCGTIVFVISHGCYSSSDKGDEYGIRITSTYQFKNNEKLYSHRTLIFDDLRSVAA